MSIAAARSPPSPAKASAAELDRVLGEVRAELVRRFQPRGHWRGGLSSSALSTAVACFAITLVSEQRGQWPEDSRALARRGLDWLAAHANADGGWGDTVRSVSNLPTTVLAWAALRAARDSEVGAVTGLALAIDGAESWIVRRTGDLQPDSLRRTIEDLYGKDKTFSVPILTLVALAGLLGPEPDCWRGITPLPFELGALPQATFRFIGLPVVSYALPALIAVGQVQHHRRPSKNLLARWLRQILRATTLRRLQTLQPSSGGFLEAIPLTGFVTLSLAGAGECDHAVVRKAQEFFAQSVREDGSWPIDVDLATWITTLSIQGLRESGGVAAAVGVAGVASLRRFLLQQQYKEIHPFTGAAPGGWAWTDLPGGVPDGDDTPGAVLALRHLGPIDDQVRAAAAAGLRWLIGLQNRDGGIPTFCRGWGTLPFDRSSPDLTAHALRAIHAWRDELAEDLRSSLDLCARRCRQYLHRVQHADGSWVPLWFGHEAAPSNENRVFGTARVLRALVELQDPTVASMIEAGRAYLLAARNNDGGWGGGEGIASSMEETALALDALSRLEDPDLAPILQQAAGFLCRAWDAGRFKQATPIGFYFANLWYFDDAYPLVFTAAALGRAQGVLAVR